MNQVSTQTLHLQDCWRIALIQCDIVLGKPKVNRANLELAMEQAATAAEKPDIILLPELWNTGYALTEIGALADPEGEIAGNGCPLLPAAMPFMWWAARLPKSAKVRYITRCRLLTAAARKSPLTPKFIYFA